MTDDQVGEIAAAIEKGFSDLGDCIAGSDVVGGDVENVAVPLKELAEAMGRIASQLEAWVTMQAHRSD